MINNDFYYKKKYQKHFLSNCRQYHTLLNSYWFLDKLNEHIPINYQFTNCIEIIASLNVLTSVYPIIICIFLI